MDNVLLTKEAILNTTESWKKILFGNNTQENINIFKTKRIKDFINKNYPEKSLKKNIDLSTLIVLLRHRNCYITLPKYVNTKNSKVKSNVELKDEKNTETRGKIISLKSNQYTFNFSVTIADEKYLEHKLNHDIDFVPKTYTLTDFYGNLQDNWDTFSFDMTDEESKYFKDILDVDNIIPTSRFVNEQLAQAMYTKDYYNMKLFIERLVAERKYIKNVKSEYIKKCKSLKDSEFENETTTTLKESKDQYESVKVMCFEVKPSEIPTFEFNYIDTTKTPEEIVDQCDELMNGLIDMTGEYKFYCRLIELAFTKMNPYKENLKPTDFQTYNNRYDCKWNEQTVKYPRSRIEWFELMFKDCSLVCRYYQKSIQQKIK